MDVSEQIFNQIRNGLLNLDPVTWIENNLNLDGKPFRINGNGYKPFADIYRYIGVKALERDSKPIIIVKGRQVGATTMAAALECFFMASGSFGSGSRRPIRVAHCFPLLDLAASYSRAKLSPMISGAKSVEIQNKNGKNKSVVEARIDKSSASNDNQFFKQFIGGNQLWIESTGIDGNRLMGKQLSLDTELPTPNGFIKLKDLKEGDQLFDEQGKICNVVKLYPIQISPESYRITFDDGTIVDACADHLWLTWDNKAIKSFNYKNPREKSFPDDWACWKSNNSNHYNATDYQIIKNMRADGYTSYQIGETIGRTAEGIQQQWNKIFKPKKSLGPQIRNTVEIAQSILVGKQKKLNHVIPVCKPIDIPDIKLPIDPWILGYLLGDGDSSGSGRVACDPRDLVSLMSEFERRGFKNRIIDSGHFYVYGLSKIWKKLNLFNNKHIPSLYMKSSIMQRKELLSGLIDADGNVDCRGIYKFDNTNKDLINGVKELSASLGLVPRIYNRPARLRKGKYGKSSSTVIICSTFPLAFLPRKLNKAKHFWKLEQKSRRIRSIEQIKSLPMRCLKVDSPSHLFLITRSFIPTHNTADIFFADEAQKMRKTAIANTTKILSQAQYGKRTKGVQVYFGTPLQSGSHYWENWNNSSQQYYYLGCKNCNDHFPLFTGNDDWEKIWLYEYVVRCTKCGFEQDKLEAAENGKWVCLNKNPEVDYIGFHINQLYNPMYTKEDIIKEQPANSPVNTERAYRNEVLGMFYSGSSAPITPEEIYEKCADHGRKFTKSIVVNEIKPIYAGFDWGDLVDIESGGESGGESSGRKGQSYSCGVILGVETPHILSIEFATLLPRNDPDYKREVVEQMFRQYSVKLAVGDVGYANDLTYILQKEHGEKFLGSRVFSSVKNHIRFENSIFPKEIQFEKDYFIKELYDLMKQGRIRFPFGNYEKIGWLVNHCCSMELKPTMDRSGELKLRYVKGSSPNDGFMALLNAYLAYKFDISQGFNVHDPNRLQIDPKDRKKIPAILGYVPTRGH